MHIRLDFKSGMPVYLQLVEQVKAAAASGSLRPGESLPAIRHLAERLRVNRNTVAKAYAELEHQGVVEAVAGKGCFLAHTDPPLTKRARLELLAAEVDRVVVQAHHLRVGRGDLLALVGLRLDAFERTAAAAAAARTPRGGS
jgi:GntR family transcriptional regulator